MGISRLAATASVVLGAISSVVATTSSTIPSITKTSTLSVSNVTISSISGINTTSISDINTTLITTNTTPSISDNTTPTGTTPTGTTTPLVFTGTPRALTSSPQLPASAPSLPPSAPRVPTGLPPGAPRVPTGIPQAPSSAPRVPTAAPQPFTSPYLPSGSPRAPTASPRVPTASPQPPAGAPRPPTTQAPGCAVSSYAGLAAALSSCSQIVIRGIEVPMNKALNLNLKNGSTVTFEGKTTFIPTGKPGRTDPLVSISGSNVRIIGAAGSTIDGRGDAYWDGVGSNSGRTIDKPKFFRLKLSNSVISGLHIVNTPVHTFSINNCHGLTLDHITIDNSKGDAKSAKGNSLGHNTDAFDVGESTNIVISNANIRNQDDCLAVNSGTDITFTNGTCIGGHGLSIGSVGGRNNNVVRNVKILNSKIINSENGVRIKTKGTQGKGSVTNIVYRGITLQNIAKRGIVIQQDYENSGPTGQPGADVHVGNITLDNIQGTVGSGGSNIYIMCAAGGCSDWNWSGLAVKGGGKADTCCHAPPGAAKFCSSGKCSV